MTNEMCRYVPADGPGLWRYETSGEIIIVAAAADPAALPYEDRETLFETFRVWQDNDTSVGGAAEVLICHPNTVRQRLRRIEKRTGRSPSRPRDLVELCLAFEVHRRLMQPKPIDTADEQKAPTQQMPVVELREGVR